MNDPLTVVLVVVVTGVLTGSLVLLFWAGNRLQGLLSRRRRLSPQPEQVAATAADVQPRAEPRAEVRLLGRLSQEEAAGPFHGLAEALRAADLDAACRWMEKELHGSDPLQLRRVLELLPDLGEAYAPPLAPLILPLADVGADPDVRIRALRALAGLKAQSDADVRQVLERARQEREPALRNAAAWAWCELERPDDLGLAKVPAGEFLMGSFEDGEQPQHVLYLTTFYIGRHLVTVGDFSGFLAASGHKLEKENRFRKRNLHVDHPVVQVGWIDAAEYARWYGMSLPSEAEWEKAARGVDGRLYPWGNEWKPGHANTLESWPSRRKATTTPVGSFSPQGDSPYGCSDMAGNVWEWIRGSRKPYPYNPADGREDLRERGFEMVRGGAADEDSKNARCAMRSSYDFRTPYELIGFRVVLKPFSSSDLPVSAR